MANLFAGDEIWVKGGSYFPTGGTVAPLTITVADIGLYGGFAGWETQREQRDWQAHETIIDGGNSYTRTISVQDNGGGITIDGFTITHGGTSATVEFFAISGINTLSNCKFIANSTFALKTAPGIVVQVLNSMFSDNGSTSISASGPLTVKDSQFINNSGTAISASQETFIDRCKFIGNTTASSGGAIFVNSATDYVTVSNSLFVGNHASRADNNGGWRCHIGHFQW